jgi:hypothetical protein
VSNKSKGIARKISQPDTQAYRLRPHNPLAAISFGAGVGYMVALAVEADDEHGTSMAVAERLVGSEYGRFSALRRGVSETFAEAAVAEFVGAAKELNRLVGAVGGQRGLHGAVMLIAKGQNVRPHAKRV